MTIAPGIFDTPLLVRLAEPIRAALAASVPHPPRLGQSEEFAALALHIIENQMLNGETIRPDGALRMAPRWIAGVRDQEIVSALVAVRAREDRSRELGCERGAIGA